MYIRFTILFWQWTIYLPAKAVRSVKTPIGCTIVARIVLLLLGILFFFTPRIAYTNGPPANPDMLTTVIYYLGIIIIVIAIFGLIQAFSQVWKNAHPKPKIVP